MGISELFLDCFAVIVVQIWLFWIPTSGTFKQLEFSLLLRYFKLSNGKFEIWIFFFRFLFYICKSPIINISILENVIFDVFTTPYYLVFLHPECFSVCFLINCPIKLFSVFPILREILYAAVSVWVLTITYLFLEFRIRININIHFELELHLIKLVVFNLNYI